MGIAFGRTWFDPFGGMGLGRTTGSGRGRALAALVALGLALSLLASPAVQASGSDATGPLVSVIVRALPRSLQTAERAVENLGGDVGRHIDIIDGFVADVPRDGLGRLEVTPGVHSVTRNEKVHPLAVIDGYDAMNDLGSMLNTNKLIKAQNAWSAGHTGQGIGVALLDTGVAPVDGLTTPGKLINGADLSFNSQDPDLRYNDGYGHGTVMAGIIAGKDAGITNYAANQDGFLGVAPDAHIVNVKVADETGATDVSQVIAGIDWVVKHRNDPGVNIRVLNLSFGTDGTQDYKIDPLAYAAEVAWRKGIVVVAAAGNAGYGSNKLNNPAYDPYVIAVGADDPKGTSAVNDDLIPSFSSTGDGVRNPDFVAPGQSIQSLRVINSYIDLNYSSGRINTRFFRGSGTSQAAAMVSGAAAILLSQRPELTPDQVKKILTSTAVDLPAADQTAQGAGLINLQAATGAGTPSVTQSFPQSTGTGSLELARGSDHLSDDGILLQGEIDIFGNPWVGSTWAPAMWNETSWSGGNWNGYAWTGDGWNGTSWTGKTWSSLLWSGKTWSGKTWSTLLWSGKTWSGKTWSSGGWTGKTWTGSSWSSHEWSSALWGTTPGYRTTATKTTTTTTTKRK